MSRTGWAKTCERLLARTAKGLSGTSSKALLLRLGSHESSKAASIARVAVISCDGLVGCDLKAVRFGLRVAGHDVELFDRQIAKFERNMDGQ